MGYRAQKYTHVYLETCYKIKPSPESKGKEEAFKIVVGKLWPISYLIF